jgi:hypothetical protein
MGNNRVAAVSPTGLLLAENNFNWRPSGHGYLLTAERLLLVPDYQAQFQLSAIQVSTVRELMVGFSLMGPGNFPLDQGSSVAVLSPAQSGLGAGKGLLVFDQLMNGATGSGVPRRLTGLPLQGSSGQGPGWSTALGDLQRRSSLRTQ